jgi:hypothetical protein
MLCNHPPHIPEMKEHPWTTGSTFYDIQTEAHPPQYYCYSSHSVTPYLIRNTPTSLILPSTTTSTGTVWVRTPSGIRVLTLSLRACRSLIGNRRAAARFSSAVIQNVWKRILLLHGNSPSVDYNVLFYSLDTVQMLEIGDIRYLLSTSTSQKGPYYPVERYLRGFERKVE